MYSVIYINSINIKVLIYNTVLIVLIYWYNTNINIV